MLRSMVFTLAVLGLAACAPGGRTGRAILADRHCYRTLGVVDCHAAPLPGEAFREVGFFDAPIAIIPAGRAF
jgi:hypothetical protein